MIFRANKFKIRPTIYASNKDLANGGYKIKDVATDEWTFLRPSPGSNPSLDNDQNNNMTLAEVQAKLNILKKSVYEVEEALKELIIQEANKKKSDLENKEVPKDETGKADEKSDETNNVKDQNQKVNFSNYKISVAFCEKCIFTNPNSSTF